MASSGTVRIETEGERKRDRGGEKERQRGRERETIYLLREEDREDTRFYRKKGENCRSSIDNRTSGR